MSQSVACLHNASHADVEHKLNAGEFFWLDLEDPPPERIQELSEKLDLHPITVGNLTQFAQRSRYDDYPNYAVLVVHGVDPEADSGSHLLREVHMVMGARYILTVHHRPMKVLDELRERWDRQQVRSEQFLIYKILDAISQTFFPVLERIDDDIDEIEESVIDSPDEAALQRIFGLKRDLVAMRRVVTPSRDAFAHHLERLNDIPGMEKDDAYYFRDLYDTLVRVSDMVDSYRDLLSGATDLYLSTVANRQGEINKSLTIIATIFLPLTFLTGFFGQNFAYLTGKVITPTWTFWALGIGLEVLSVLGFLVYFRTRKWT